jgi:hypothetical protein
MASAAVEAMPPIDVANTNASDKAAAIDNALAHNTATASGISEQVEPPADPNHEEFQYLKLIRDILDNGEHRPDRYIPNHPLLQEFSNTPSGPAQAPSPSSRPPP